jgi:hypothetical protein
LLHAMTRRRLQIRTSLVHAIDLLYIKPPFQNIRHLRLMVGALSTPEQSFLHPHPNVTPGRQCLVTNDVLCRYEIRTIFEISRLKSPVALDQYFTAAPSDHRPAFPLSQSLERAATHTCMSLDLRGETRGELSFR